jgi:hypothetical protein
LLQVVSGRMWPVGRQFAPSVYEVTCIMFDCVILFMLIAVFKCPSLPVHNMNMVILSVHLFNLGNCRTDTVQMRFKFGIGVNTEIVEQM